MTPHPPVFKRLRPKNARPVRLSRPSHRSESSSSFEPAAHTHSGGVRERCCQRPPAPCPTDAESTHDRYRPDTSYEIHRHPRAGVHLLPDGLPDVRDFHCDPHRTGSRLGWHLAVPLRDRLPIAFVLSMAVGPVSFWLARRTQHMLAMARGERYRAAHRARKRRRKRKRADPKARPFLSDRSEDHSALAAFATSTVTPGPMVELSEIFFM